MSGLASRQSVTPEWRPQGPCLDWTRQVFLREGAERCHADVLISLFRQTFPTAHDRDRETQPPPTASVLDFLAKLRNELEEDEGSSADDGGPPTGAGWRGKGQPMMIGSGCVTREVCDGQSLVSPGR